MPALLWDNSAERKHWQDYYGRHSVEKLGFVHAGTGGSSGSLPIDGFTRLLTRVRQSSKVAFKAVLTYSGEEKALVTELRDQLVANGVNAELAMPLHDLAEFARSLVAADMFIAGSTGPLHLAGLHDIPTVGFYAGRRSRPDIRWQTLTQASKRLSFTPPIGRRTGRNMSLIDVEKAGSEIAGFLDAHYIN
jgi:ADP-heptose:LPS heptosyltransferase